MMAEFPIVDLSECPSCEPVAEENRLLRAENRLLRLLRNVPDTEVFATLVQAGWTLPVAEDQQP